jgi:hypothetical protein
MMQFVPGHSLFRDVNEQTPFIKLLSVWQTGVALVPGSPPTARRNASMVRLWTVSRLRVNFRLERFMPAACSKFRAGCLATMINLFGG